MYCSAKNVCRLSHHPSALLSLNPYSDVRRTHGGSHRPCSLPPPRARTGRACLRVGSDLQTWGIRGHVRTNFKRCKHTSHDVVTARAEHLLSLTSLRFLILLNVLFCRCSVLFCSALLGEEQDFPQIQGIRSTGGLSGREGAVMDVIAFLYYRGSRS